MQTSVTAAVIDAHALLRDRLAQLLAASGQIQVVGEASTGWDAIELITSVRPDVAVIGPSLPDEDCSALVRAVEDERLPTRLLVLPRPPEEPSADRALHAGTTACHPPDASELALVEEVLAISSRGTTPAPVHGIPQSGNENADENRPAWS